MDKLTHAAALRAATRVAFGIAVLGGCTAASEEETVATESEINKAPCPSKADAGAKADAAPAKPSCDSVLASAFPDAADGGDNFMDSRDAGAVSDEVKACCEEHLTSDAGATWQKQYRWSCCGVLDNWNSPNQSIGMACTPWGPPVPPRMRAVA